MADEAARGRVVVVGVHGEDEEHHLPTRGEMLTAVESASVCPIQQEGQCMAMRVVFRYQLILLLLLH